MLGLKQFSRFTEKVVAPPVEQFDLKQTLQLPVHDVQAANAAHWPVGIEIIVNVGTNHNSRVALDSFIRQNSPNSRTEHRQ